MQHETNNFNANPLDTFSTKPLPLDGPTSFSASLASDTTRVDKPKTRRTLPLLELYEFQTLANYAAECLVFTGKDTLVCTPLKDVYNDYLTFFYTTQYKGTASFQDFLRILEGTKGQKRRTKKDLPRGLTTKYQFGRALLYVAKVQFNVEIAKVKNQELVLQGVGLRNPNSGEFQNVHSETMVTPSSFFGSA